MRFGVSSFAALAAANEHVERWGQFEVSLTGQPPADSNPFTDVDLSCTFTSSDVHHVHEAVKTVPLDPVLAFDFEQGSQTSIPNEGKSSGSASLDNVQLSEDVPAGASGKSLDFGVDTSSAHRLTFPSDGSSFNALDGATAFTISGWLNLRSADMGAGGNRILSWCHGGPGIDLVWVNSGSLKLSVNEFPDNAHPQSSANSVAMSEEWPRWQYFAVTYDSEAIDDENVKWYFGNSYDAASRDSGAKNAQYNQGRVQEPDLPLSFGGFCPGCINGPDRVFRGGLFQPRMFDRALTEDEIVQVQQRASCQPDCSRSTCGDDGCGGTCGTCAASKVCAAEDVGEHRCSLPSTITVNGFYDGGSDFKCRFSPHREGAWSYTTKSSMPELDGKTGSFTAVPPTDSNHGPVEAVGHRLMFADGSPYFSVGTTSYQWSSMGFDMQNQTLETLRNGQGEGQVFNKMRMTVFPKWYVFNHANPVETGTAYEIIPGSPADDAENWGCTGHQCPSMAGSFDLQRFNVSYWQNYERLLGEMRSMGVIADIIVFHPYDNNQWGFDCMGGTDKDSYDTTNDNLYLKYLTSRLASFSNVWWSMSNEWDFCDCKRKGVQGDFGSSPTWDELFVSLQGNDPYARMSGIHNGGVLYNHGQPWITHVSLQGSEDRTPELRTKFGKPVIWDEVKYEGNIGNGWGALSGQEETDRFWWGAALGAYVGHSETVLHPNIENDDDQPLWWAKGGTLIGKSPARIKWFRSIWEDTANRPEFGSLRPSVESFGNSESSVSLMLSSRDDGYKLLHLKRPGEWTLPLSSTAGGAAEWEVRSLDYWKMTVSVDSKLPGTATEATIVCDAIPCNVEIAHVAKIVSFV